MPIKRVVHMPPIAPYELLATAATTSLTSDFLVADGSCPKIRKLLAEALVPVLWLEAGQHLLKMATAP